MIIVVCVKPVPDPDKYNLLSIDPETKRLIREGIPSIVNPSDKNALEAALQIKEKVGGKVIILSMAPLFSKEKIKECLAMGADAAYLISDSAFGGADTYATSYTLAKAMEAANITPDLVLCGNESADGATSHVPSQLGEWLALSHIANVESLEIDNNNAKVRKKIENGTINFEVALPALFAIARNSNTPRLISTKGIILSRNKPLQVLTKEDIQLDEALIGLAGSPTQAGKLITPDMHRKAVPLEGNLEEIAIQILQQLRRAGIAVRI